MARQQLSDWQVTAFLNAIVDASHQPQQLSSWDATQFLNSIADHQE
jgi:hypothetical protein